MGETRDRTSDRENDATLEEYTRGDYLAPDGLCSGGLYCSLGNVLNIEFRCEY